MFNNQTVTGTTESLQQRGRLLVSNREPLPSSTQQPKDLICFSHLRWNFVYQRPQHLLTNASSHYRVWFWEEPVWDDHDWLEIRQVGPQLHTIVPHLQPDTDFESSIGMQKNWFNSLLALQGITNFIGWYYTPMALLFTSHVRCQITVYDCMDELSAFQGAPPQLQDLERQLMQRSGLVFTGGFSLFEAKQKLHPSVHAFPSSIEYEHFAQARKGMPDPIDQQPLPYPRIGYSGVIDERLDLKLLAELAHQHPQWQFILLGPVVKIDPATLPQGANLHYLGMKSYVDLPAYFSNWQVALLPFALNEATRFISPTKTPEYLAGGLPVVSTPIRDVVTTYGDCGLVWIADTVELFEKSIEEALLSPSLQDWSRIDAQLSQNSWQLTWQAMNRLIENQLLTLGLTSSVAKQGIPL